MNIACKFILAVSVVSAGLWGAPVEGQETRPVGRPTSQPTSAPATQRQGDLKARIDAIFKEAARRARQRGYIKSPALAKAEALDKKVLSLLQAGKYAQAVTMAREVLQIHTTELGAAHVDTADSMSVLAELYRRMGKYKEAEPLYRSALAIKEKILGPEHPSTAISVNNLGLLYSHTGRYAKAEPLLKRALKIKEKTLGPDNTSTAASLTNLAALYRNKGQHGAAEPLFRRALDIARKSYGRDHPKTALALNNLAILNYETGRNNDAKSLLQQALRITESRLGSAHPATAQSLNNLASVYHETGDYTVAGALYTRALKIREKALGGEHVHVAETLNNLSLLYRDTGRYKHAKLLCQRALAIWKKAVGPEHPRFAMCLANFAVIIHDTGDRKEAARTYRHVLSLYEKALGREHPEMARCLNNLAVLHHEMKDMVTAEKLFKRALAIKQKVPGRADPDTAGCLFNLAFLSLERNNLQSSWDYAAKAREMLLKSRRRASESALTRSSFYSVKTVTGLVPVLALKLGKEADVLGLLEQEQALGLRELLVEGRAETFARLPEKDRQRLIAALARINGLNAAIGRDRRSRRPVEKLRVQLQQGEIEYESLMRELSGKYEQFAAAETRQAITSNRAVKSLALANDTAVVGWLEHRHWAWGYVVRTTGVKWVDLAKGFDGAEQRKLVRSVRSAGRRSDEPGFSAQDALKLYRTRITPLEKHLAGVRKLIVINQGWVAALPVEMLLTGEPPENADISDWPWLARKYEISYAPSVTTLDILCRQRQKRKAKKWTRPLFALADPPFSENQLTAMKLEKAPQIVPVLAAADVGDSALTRLLRFDLKAMPRRLPGTRYEALMIASVLEADKSSLLLGPNASERRLFEAGRSGKLKECRYVHIATHGLADSDRPELSGLVLARVPPDKDYDGILQMREVFHLQLDADLVVLSACQTGLGKHLGGEGIVGLSTAFFFAGTPSLVMSLWNVPDAPTALLMHRFYSNLKAGKTKAAALREAKKWLRNLTLDDLKKLGRTDPMIGQLTRGLGKPTTAPKGHRVDIKLFAHPHYWAGFILTGDPQ